VDLKLDHGNDDGVETVGVQGEIDIHTAPRFRELLLALIDQGCLRVVVDLEGVAFVDSTGLGVLVGALKRIRAHGGSLALVCTRKQILNVLDLTGLAEVFDVYLSADEAARAFEPAIAP
jgi:anti-sigma B factor antagonist